MLRARGAVIARSAKRGCERQRGKAIQKALSGLPQHSSRVDYARFLRRHPTTKFISGDFMKPYTQASSEKVNHSAPRFELDELR